MLPTRRWPRITATWRAGLRALPRRPVQAIAACAGVKNDPNRALARHRSWRKRINEGRSPALPGDWRRDLYISGYIAADLAPTGGLRAADLVDCAGGGAQFRLVPDHAHADDHVVVLHFPLRILAHFDDRSILPGPRQSLGGAGRVFYFLPAGGRVVCILHFVSGLLSDDLAAAARSGTFAG